MNNYPTYLVHFGIKGQKWGDRRYQNEDGTLTPEGKKRYGKLDKMSDERLYKTLKKEIRNKRSKQLGWSNRWMVGEPIGPHSKKLIEERDLKEKEYKNSDAYKKWDAQYEKLLREADINDYAQKYVEPLAKIMQEVPKKNFNTLHYKKVLFSERGSHYIDNWEKKGGKDLSLAYLKDLNYDDKKAKEYVKRLMKKYKTLGDI